MVLDIATQTDELAAIEAELSAQDLSQARLGTLLTRLQAVAFPAPAASGTGLNTSDLNIIINLQRRHTALLTSTVVRMLYLVSTSASASTADPDSGTTTLNRNNAVARLRVSNPERYAKLPSQDSYVWLLQVEAAFAVAQQDASGDTLSDSFKIHFTVTLFDGDAVIWWATVKSTPAGIAACETWALFRTFFLESTQRLDRLEVFRKEYDRLTFSGDPVLLALKMRELQARVGASKAHLMLTDSQLLADFLRKMPAQVQFEIRKAGVVTWDDSVRIATEYYNSKGAVEMHTARAAPQAHLNHMGMPASLSDQEPSQLLCSACSDVLPPAATAPLPAASVFQPSNVPASLHAVSDQVAGSSDSEGEEEAAVFALAQRNYNAVRRQEMQAAKTGKTATVNMQAVRCYGCGELGHYRRNCPHNTARNMPSFRQRPGNSRPFNNAWRKPRFSNRFANRSRYFRRAAQPGNNARLTAVDIHDDDQMLSLDPDELVYADEGSEQQLFAWA
jgi:hypothetical protein